MTKKWIVAALAAVAAQAGAQEASPFKTEQDMASYGIGMQMAKSFKQADVEIDPQLILRGLRDGMAGTTLVPDKVLRKAMGEFQGEVRRKFAAKQLVAAEENRKKGEAYLAQYKAKEGVVTLASGLEYRILKTGEGKMPTEADSVECLYRGTLLDGTEFDGTESDKPATLKLSQLIPGWKEALKLMPAGSKWEMVVPPQLAYGARGAGNDIGPNETLVFQVELLAVK